MDLRGLNWVVNSEFLPELAGEAILQAADESDEEGHPGFTVVAHSRDRDETGEHSIA